MSSRQCPCCYSFNPLHHTGMISVALTRKFRVETGLSPIPLLYLTGEEWHVNLRAPDKARQDLLCLPVTYAIGSSAFRSVNRVPSSQTGLVWSASLRFHACKWTRAIPCNAIAVRAVLYSERRTRAFQQQLLYRLWEELTWSWASLKHRPSARNYFYLMYLNACDSCRKSVPTDLLLPTNKSWIDNYKSHIDAKYSFLIGWININFIKVDMN
jgi:hypothetical protein